MMESKIRIFIACHKPTYILNNYLLVPVQVGARIAKERIPNMMYDDEGDSISEKNAAYCELTAQYWAWRNIDSDYYGFFHYRRYLSFGKVYPVTGMGTLQEKKYICPYEELDDIRDDLSGYGLDETRMKEVIEQYDLLTVLRERINTTVYRQYCQYHPQVALDKVLEILKKKYPEYQDAVSEYMGGKEIYYMNMYIMKKPLFLEYASWLFDILGTLETDTEFSEYGKSEERLMGYLAERLFGVFYTQKRKMGVSCAELPYLKFYNTDLSENGKGEYRRQNIRKFRLKPTRVEVEIDMRKFNKMFPAGTLRRILIRNIFLR